VRDYATLSAALHEGVADFGDRTLRLPVTDAGNAA
jgi:hypothetical protein